jgi:hypothetical protein
MKDVKKMQEQMKEASYHYCSNHDVYFDEWLACPACALETLLLSLQRTEILIEQYKKITKKFDPNDRG